MRDRESQSVHASGEARRPPVDIIKGTRQTEAYQKASGNERAQMLFDAVAGKYGHAGALFALALFAGTREARDDFESFAVGSEKEGFNTGQSAARHFFWSASVTASGNPLAAFALGNIKETYDLVGRKLRLPGAGHFDVKDLSTNAAGRRLGLRIYQIWFDRKADPMGHVDLSRFTTTPPKGY